MTSIFRFLPKIVQYIVFIKILAFLSFSCSSEDEYRNSPPMNLSIENISFQANIATII